MDGGKKHLNTANLSSKIQYTRCIFRASVATLGGLSTEKKPQASAPKKHKNMQVQVIRYIWTGGRRD